MLSKAPPAYHTAVHKSRQEEPSSLSRQPASLLWKNLKLPISRRISEESIQGDLWMASPQECLKWKSEHGCFSALLATWEIKGLTPKVALNWPQPRTKAIHSCFCREAVHASRSISHLWKCSTQAKGMGKSQALPSCTGQVMHQLNPMPMPTGCPAPSRFLYLQLFLPCSPPYTKLWLWHMDG